MVFAYSQDDSMETCYDKWYCKATWSDISYKECYSTEKEMCILANHCDYASFAREQFGN